MIFHTNMPIIILDGHKPKKNTLGKDVILFLQHIFTCRPKTLFFLVLSLLGLLIIIHDYRVNYGTMHEEPDALDAILIADQIDVTKSGQLVDNEAGLLAPKEQSEELMNALNQLDRNEENVAEFGAQPDDNELGDWIEDDVKNEATEGYINQKENINILEDYIIYERDYIASFQRFDIGNAQIKFLKEFQSPCFLENTTDEQPYSKNNMMQKNINYKKKNCFVEGLRDKSHAEFVTLPALGREYRVRCLPYFMLLGFAKCGTSDFQFRSATNKYLLKGFTKEYYWWDQYRFTANASLSDYSDIFDSGLKNLMTLKSGNDEKPYFRGATGEMTTITLNSMAYWRQDPRNAGLKEPKYLTPHDLYPILPHVKLIILMRNPVSRLYSHYNMWAPFRRFKVGPEDFHNRVVNSIRWWENCTRILPIRGCLYGSPPEVQPVEYELSSWWQKEYNHSGEFRAGFYSLFINDWLQVFPRDQFLFLKSEEYREKKEETLNDIVYPFLNIPKVEGKEKEKIASMKQVFAKSYDPMLNETKEILTQFYKPYNEKLAHLLGEDKWLWND